MALLHFPDPQSSVGQLWFPNYPVKDTSVRRVSDTDDDDVPSVLHANALSVLILMGDRESEAMTP